MNDNKILYGYQFEENGHNNVIPVASRGTTECKAYIATDHGVEYTLVDTPGFDDSSRDDMEILKSIAGYLGSRGRPSISGIIYLHRITDNRMTGTSAVNLQMLKKLCGELFYPHVTLVSTMWDKIPTEDMHVLARNREQQLIESDYWGEMVRRGSRIFQFHGDRDSGLNILRNLSKSTAGKLPLPQLVAERNQGRAWEETAAGQIILEERHKREQKRIKDMAEEKAELEAEKAELQKEMRRNHWAPIAPKSEPITLGENDRTQNASIPND
ncbi:hypothetical protein KJ359_002596 [Pestalotiopsis sp. 9143b]|nr:hypothetical protein KJ359_002596 [Pestalotiopsis sp. 9143b]